MRRRLLLILSTILVVALTVALTLPLWFGLALRQAPDSLGLSFRRYERIGYARFAVEGVELRRERVTVTAARVEADTPLLYLWRKTFGSPGEVRVAQWSVEVQPRPADAPPPVPQRASGWVPLRARLRGLATQLEKWLPSARTDAGVVRWNNGELTLVSAEWRERTLRVDDFVLNALRADLTGRFPAEADEIQVSARTKDEAGHVNLTSRGQEVEGRITWWEQPATFTARFAERGWLPETARLEANEWNVPAARLKLGASYAHVRGWATVDWDTERFRAEVTALGLPLPEKKVPPLEVEVRAHGNLREFTIDRLRAVAPGLLANLTEPVTVDRAGTIKAGAARFAVRADLAEQPWFEARGTVEGEAQVVQRDAAAPVVEFQLHASEVVAQGVGVAQADMVGQLAWPRLELARATLRGTAGDGITARGGWDFSQRELLPVAIEGELRRATLARWLPAQPVFDTVRIDATAEGPVAQARHAGSVSADAVRFKGVHPLAVTLSWSGMGRAVEDFDLHAGAGATRLSATGALEADALQLRGLEIVQADSPRLKLSTPATLRWRPNLQLEALHLAGPDGAVLEAGVTWGETGEVQFVARNIASSWWTDLFPLRGPAWQVTSTALTGKWDRGPMTFTAVFGAGVELAAGRRASVNLAGSGDERGIRLEALRAAEGAESIVHATGVVPIVVHPGTSTMVRIDRAAALEIDAETAPNAAFWAELAAMTGFELNQPQAAAHLRGTWASPRGEVALRVARVAADPKRFKRPLPTIEDVNVVVLAAADSIQLERFGLKVEGQALAASGKLPVAAGEWTRVFKEPMRFVRRGADLRLEIPNADLNAFARFLPSMLTPKGRVQLAATYRGGAMNGTLKLSDAATRPLGPLGALQEIEADIALSGDALALRSVQATSGGEMVRLTGRVILPMLTLPPSATPEEKEPRFDIALQGQNLPFVRKTGLLVRGDLDLKLNTTERGGERVTGTVRLRDSLFLQDVRALLPRGGANSRARRPPYFSIENAPLNRWRLDVRVEGDHFMRLRTTLFNGVASARFHLTGTLEEPIAIGDAIVEEGRIRLPFASFEVREGRVMLTREQPFEPQLWVAAETRRYGYDLRMELSGAATAPVLAFSSSPPLEHGQVLLMVMAGEAPQDEVTYTDQQRATQLGKYLGQSLLASFGAAEGGDRLTITSGEKISEQGRETLELEYELNDTWSLTGEYDEFDDYNAGVKWKVYTREGKGAAEP